MSLEDVEKLEDGLLSFRETAQVQRVLGQFEIGHRLFRVPPDGLLEQRVGFAGASRLDQEMGEQAARLRMSGFNPQGLAQRLFGVWKTEPPERGAGELHLRGHGFALVELSEVGPP